MQMRLLTAAAILVAAIAASDSPARAQGCAPTDTPSQCWQRMTARPADPVPPVDHYLQQQRLRDLEEQQRQQQLQLDQLRRQQTIDRINTPCVPVAAWRC